MTGLGQAMAAAALAVALAASAAAAEVPQLTGRVVDDAEILKAPTRAELSELLQTHEQRSGDQIAVLTVPTIGDDSIEDFARRVFEQWKLGQKGKDNGVLVIVVPNDRKMRIEVGYGLEGSLPDLVANRIIRNQMAPRFKDNDYDQGVLDGVKAVVAGLEGRPVAAAEPAGPTTRLSEQRPDMPWPARILFGVFTFGILGLFTYIGIRTPGMGWFIYVFLIPFWASFPIAIVGGLGTLVLIAIYLVGFPVTKLMWSRTASYQKAVRSMRKKGGASVGGFWAGSSASSSSSSSDSGFSGSGGSSGGGGSSGSW